MEHQLREMIPQEFDDNSRVWIFQASRPFADKEKIEIDEQLNQFYQQWKAHGDDVHGWAGLLWNRFIVVIADEVKGATVSGCSTDSMMRVVKSLERQYNVELFNRLSISFLVKDKVEMLPLQQVQYALDKGYITKETIIFNNLVENKGALMTQWLQPLKESWLATRVNI